MSRIILTAAEVQELTGKVRPSAQARYLALMGIAYTRRPDRNGTIVVYRETQSKDGRREPQVQLRNPHLAEEFKPEKSAMWMRENLAQFMKTEEELIASAVPIRETPLASGIYFLIFEGQQIAYLGKSVNMNARIYAHIRKGCIPFQSVASVECDTPCLTVLELAYWEKFKPYCNMRRPQ